MVDGYGNPNMAPMEQTGGSGLIAPMTDFIGMSLRFTTIRPEVGFGAVSLVGGMAFGMLPKWVGRSNLAMALSPIIGGGMSLGGTVPGVAGGAGMSALRKAHGDLVTHLMSPAGGGMSRKAAMAAVDDIANPKRWWGGGAIDKTLDFISPGMAKRNRVIMAGIKQGIATSGISKTAATYGATRVGLYGAMVAAPWVGGALLVADTLRAGYAAKQAVHRTARSIRNYSGQTEFGAANTTNMVYGETVLTERQRALQSIGQSNLNARYAFGAEARRAHMLPA